ncbi:MAG: hypothetical protein EOO41_01300 [Methanobacteriota archaeon]|nr:MAG: hypothetical protein EOO41_01300 [Euryarchaeota archaeon]
MLDSATSYSLSEVRGTRGGTVTWLAMSGSNTTTVSVSALSGDITAKLTFGSNVVLVLAARLVSAVTEGGEYDAAPAVVQSVSSSFIAVRSVRTFALDGTDRSLTSVNVNMLLGSTLVAAPVMTVSGVTLTVAGALSGMQNLTVGAGGTVSISSTATSVASASPEFTFDSVSVLSDGTFGLAPNAIVHLSSLMTNGTATISLASGCTLDVTRTLSLGAASTVSFAGRATIRAKDAQLLPGSLLSGVGGGSAAATGLGGTPTANFGAAHAGCASQGTLCGVTGTSNSAYGDFLAPVAPGSGGGASTTGGAGGAALRLITRTLTLNGSINANGAQCVGAATPTASCGGGGSGGSVWISTDTLLPSSGSVSASGGAGAHGGSGGRIALYCNDTTASLGLFPNASSSSLSIVAYGGRSAATAGLYGAAGTVYADCGAAAVRALSIVNDPAAAATSIRETFLLPSLPGNFSLGSVTLRRFTQASVWPLDAAATSSTHLSVIGQLLGDATGKWTVRAGTASMLNVANVASFVSNTTFAVQYLSSTRRQLVVTTPFYDNMALINASHVTVNPGGQLILPDDVLVCNVDVTNNGQIVGARNNFTFCPAHLNKRVLGTPTVLGCTNTSAANYNPLATMNDGSCITEFPTVGCTYRQAVNYNPAAQINDGTCLMASGMLAGCTCPSAANYAPSATLDDGSCSFLSTRRGCTYSGALRLHTCSLCCRPSTRPPHPRHP